MIAKSKPKKKLIVNIVEWLLVSVFAIFLAFILVFASKSPTNTQSGSIFGFETRLVLTSSMDGPNEFYTGKNYRIKAIEPGSVVFIANLNTQNETEKDKFFAELKKGDVITYFSNIYGDYITHRIVEIATEPNDIILLVQGDNVDHNNLALESISKHSNQVVGKVVGQSAFVGWIYVNFLSNKYLVYISIIIPCIIGMGIATYHIVKEVKIAKRIKIERAAREVIKDEIAKLRQEIAELKKEKGGQD